MTAVEPNKAMLLEKQYEAGEDESKFVSLYNETADIYHEVFSKGTWLGPSKVAETVASLIKCDKKKCHIQILDFGAGTGLSGMALKEHGFSTIDALDVSKGMVDVAQTKSNGKLYREVLIGNLKCDNDLLEESSYDIIVSVGVIGTHVFDTNEIHRLMSSVKPGGYIVYTIKAEANKAESFQKMYESLQQDQEEEKKSEVESNGIIDTEEWSVAHLKEVGSLNLDYPAVKHDIVVLQRTL